MKKRSIKCFSRFMVITLRINIFISFPGSDKLFSNKIKSKRYFKSFLQDIELLETSFQKEISVIFENPKFYKKIYSKRDPQIKAES